MILLTLLTACEGPLGPGQMCTEMYMESGLTLNLSGDFAPGAYRVEADDGETLISCDFDLPDASGEDWIFCDDETGSRVELADADTPSAVRLVEFLPQALDVRVFVDDVEIAAESYDDIPYEETEYNGEGCDYAYNADVDLAL